MRYLVCAGYPFIEEEVESARVSLYCFIFGGDENEKMCRYSNGVCHIVVDWLDSPGG
jgi:hypothetical protein